MSTRPDLPLSPLTLDAVQAKAIVQKIAAKQYGPGIYIIDLQRQAASLPDELFNTASGERDTVTRSLLRIAADALLLIEWLEGNHG